MFVIHIVGFSGVTQNVPETAALVENSFREHVKAFKISKARGHLDFHKEENKTRHHIPSV